jgi:hypothetical protein
MTPPEQHEFEERPCSLMADAVKEEQARIELERFGPKKDTTCGMERFSKEGLCGRPATHIWKHDDGDTPVCDRCLPSVLVNHGNLEPITTHES